jgi:conjugal transfer pilus assembly protein TraF
MKVLILLLGLFTTELQAGWNTEHEEGWHWYQDPEVLENPNPSVPSAFHDPLTEIETLREHLDRSRAEAILRPTESAVKSYIEQQVQATQKADRFSLVWDAVIRQYPQLDYALTHPTAQFARHIYLDNQKLQVKTAIDRFKETYGFLFFFRSDCPYCQAMAPIIKTVSLQHGITVTAISLDGGSLTESFKVLPDNGIASKMGVLSVPAVFAVNPNTDEWFPIVTGPISVSDLEERIWAIADYMNEEENLYAANHP